LFLGHNSWTRDNIFIKNSFPSRYIYNLYKNLLVFLQLVRTMDSPIVIIYGG
jgi:hypothetical protein